MAVKVLTSILPRTPNVPTRDGDRVQKATDIATISLPYEGQIVYVEEEEAHYKITQLDTDGLKAVNWKLLNTETDLTKVFKWQGTVESVDALDAKIASASLGDTWTVENQGNYSFVPESISWKLANGSALPQGMDSIFTLHKSNNTVAIQINSYQQELALLLARGTNYPNEYVLGATTISNGSISANGLIYGYSNQITKEEDGPNSIVVTIVPAHFTSMGGQQITVEQVNALISASRAAIDADHKTKLDAKQATLLSAQLAAVNSGITADKVSKLDGLKASDIDENLSIIKFTSGSKTYYAEVKQLIAPSAPTIDNTSYSVVSGNIKVIVNCDTPEATIKYALGDSIDWNTYSDGITIASTFTNSPTSNNVQWTKTIKVKSIFKGVESNVNTYTITITPKVANGSIGISRSPENSQYGTSATITLSASSTLNSKSYYSVDEGATWTEFTGTKTITVSEGKDAELYQVKAIKTNYTDADIQKSNAFSLNAKHCYYGCSTSASISSVTGLTGGGKLSLTKPESGKQYTITSNGSSSVYMYICCVGTLTSSNIMVNSTNPIDDNWSLVGTINGWNIYRNASVLKFTSRGFYIKN